MKENDGEAQAGCENTTSRPDYPENISQVGGV